MPTNPSIKESNIAKDTEFITDLSQQDYEPAPKTIYYVDSGTVKALLKGNLNVKDKFLAHDKAISISQIVRDDLLLEALRADNQELWEIYKEIFKIYNCWQIDQDDYLKKCINLEKECQNKGLNLNWQTIQELALCIKGEEDWHWIKTVYITSQSVDIFTIINNLRVENWTINSQL